MSISLYDKLQLEQRELERKLDEIAARKARDKYEGMKPSYCMHTPKAAMQRLGERSRK